MGAVQWMQPPVCRRTLGPSSLCLKKELGRSLTFRKLPFLAEPQPPPGKATNPNKELSAQPGVGMDSYQMASMQERDSSAGAALL